MKEEKNILPQRRKGAKEEKEFQNTKIGGQALRRDVSVASAIFRRLVTTVVCMGMAVALLAGCRATAPTLQREYEGWPLKPYPVAGRSMSDKYNFSRMEMVRHLERLEDKYGEMVLAKQKLEGQLEERVRRIRELDSERWENCLRFVLAYCHQEEGWPAPGTLGAYKGRLT